MSPGTLCVSQSKYLFSKILKISNVEQKFAENSIQLLKDIYRSCIIRIPYQNISDCLRHSTMERLPFPVPDDSKESFTQGRGGYCYHNHIFMKQLLDSIGYQTFYITGSIRPPKADLQVPHVALMVNIANKSEKEDLFYFDIGSGISLTLEPLRMKNLPYCGRIGGMDYEYNLSTDGKLRRVNKGGDSLVGMKPHDYLSGHDFDMNTSSNSKFDIYNYMLDRLLRKSTTFFRNVLYCQRYVEISPDLSDFKFVHAMNTKLIICTKEQRKVLNVARFEDMEMYINEFFPMIPKEHVQQAMHNILTKIRQTNNKIQ